MSTIKSFAVGNGDMYYIRHGSDNFSIIDCALPADREGAILAELAAQSSDKGITRFISTHPDQDHISGLVELDDTMALANFYCVRNATAKAHHTADFERYCQLRDDSTKAFYLHRDCSRRWMNQTSEERGSSGLNCLWPILGDPDHESALVDAAAGLPPNNISGIIRYNLNNGASVLWMGDLETDFMDKLEPKIVMPRTDILFAPHHGRASGKVPRPWLEEMDPGLIIIGQAPSEYLDYYRGYNIITQNSAGDLLFDCVDWKVHIYASDHTYVANCLDDEGLDHAHGLYYVGTLGCHSD
jgi:beta-lactamase superfamily II metal-dependent hydrolase